MIGRRCAGRWLLSLLALCAGGCSLILPENVGKERKPNRTQVRSAPEAAMLLEENLTDGYWLEVERGREPGRLGGYFSDPPNPSPTLVIVLGGASSFEPGGPIDASKFTHEYYAPRLGARGHRIWTLVRRECGTPYGGDDVLDVIEALDWLEREGQEWLGVERVYLYGYSTGATQANLANRQRQVTAIVSISGLTRPNQFEEFWGLYQLIAAMFPRNTGICQLRTTLEVYGPPGAPGWEALNTVDHLDELLSPMLLVQSSADPIYFNHNLRELRARYEQLVASGAQVAPLEFLYVPRLNHYEVANDPQVVEYTFDYIDRFERVAEQRQNTTR